MRLITILLVAMLCLVLAGTTFARNAEYLYWIHWAHQHDVKVIDTLVFCAVNNALVVLDLDYPGPPIFVSQYRTQKLIYSLDISNGYAYLTNESDGLQIIDISDPASPIWKGSYKKAGQASDVFVAGNYAYLTGWSGLRILDISDPSAPLLVGSYKAPDFARGVFVVDDYAYMTNGQFGLQIIDISDPSAPLLAGSYDTPGDARGIYVSDRYAYVADGKFGLQIIDILDPSGPKLAGSYKTPDRALGVHVSDNLAYVADCESGLQVVDVSYPSAPAWKGSYDTPGMARRAVIADGYTYVADISGMIILNLNPTGDAKAEIIPHKFSISQNYPNPFNSVTMIKYELSHQARVSIDIYDALGRKVTSLVNSQQPAGYHQVLWDAEDFASGIYFYKIQAGDYGETMKMVLIK